jgi:hypothetical protein
MLLIQYWKQCYHLDNIDLAKIPVTATKIMITTVLTANHERFFGLVVKHDH